MTRRSMQESMHPALPWAWAGLLLVLLVSGRSRSEYATSLAVIVSSFIIFKAAKIPPQRRRVFYLGISLAGFAIAFRLGIALIIGVPMPGTVLFHIPELTLPHFIVGIRIGGAVTSDRLLSALSESLLFAAIVISTALANSLKPPHALLRTLPRRLFGLGVATSIATSVTPQTALSISRVNRALHLRGDTSRGLNRARRLMMPVLEESLERSIDLASALEVRGYGRTRNTVRYRASQWKVHDSIPVTAILLVGLALPYLQANAGVEFFLILAAALTVLIA